MNKIAQTTMNMVVLALGFFFILGFMFNSGDADESVVLNDFNVTWHDCKYGLTQQMCYVDIQNLDLIAPRNFSLSGVISDTNYIDSYNTNMTIYLYEPRPFEIPIYETVEVNETRYNITYNNETGITTNETYYVLVNQTNQIGTETKMVNQWEPTKSNMLKEGIQEKMYYGIINIPKLYGEPETDDYGVIYEENGTKRFKVEWTTPITKINGAWGSAGKIAFWDENTEYHPWWSSSWGYKEEIPIDGIGDSIPANYQFKITVDYDSDMQTDFDDLRFVNSAEDTELSYWIETKTDSTSAVIWIKVPTISNTVNSTIYMYFGNPAVSTTSNIQNTMIFGDDFNDNSIDGSRWGGDTSYADESGGVLSIEGNSWKDITSISKYSYPIIFESLSKATAYNSHHRFGLYDSSLTEGSLFAHDVNSGQEAVQNWNSGLKGGSISVSETTYNKYRINWIGSNSKFYYNDVYVKLLDDNVPTHDMYVNFGSDDSGDYIYSDYVFLRTYSASEPIYSFGEKESGNTAPTITANSTSPATIYANTDTTANLTVTDPDSGDTLTAYIQFYVNDSAIGEEYSTVVTNNTNTLVATLGSGNYSKGNTISTEYWVGDGTVNTSKSNMTDTVQNSIPTIGNPTLNESTPYTDEILLCSNGSYSDIDDDTANWYYKWYDGNTEISGQTSSTLDLNVSGLDKGDTIKCSTIADDGTANATAWTNSTTATIQNTAPTIPDISPTTNANITVDYQLITCENSTDADSDTIYYTIYGDTNTNPTTVLQNTTDTTYNWTSLNQDYNYFKCAATDGEDVSANTTTYNVFVDTIGPTVTSYYQWNSTNDTVDFGIWTDGFVSVNWNLTDTTGINTSSCSIKVRNKNSVTNYTNHSYIDDNTHPDYDNITGYKDLTCYTEDLGGGVTRVSANMTRSYDWRPLNTAFDQDNATHDNAYYSHGSRSTKIVFHNVTDTINTTFIFLADVDNQTNTVADMDFYACNSSYTSGDFTTSPYCALVGAATPDSARDANFNYLIGALETDENGTYGGVKLTETMYGMSYCKSCTNTGNAWITYSTNGYDGHSATSPNQGATWTDLTGEEFNVILHVIDNTQLEFNLTIDDTLGNQLSDLQIDEYGIPGNKKPYGDITTDNITGDLVSYYDIHGITESGTICINVTAYDPNGDTMNVSIYLLNNDSSANQTLLSNYSVDAYGIICYQWNTTNISDGDYRLNVTAFDGFLTGYDESAGFVRIAQDTTPPVITNIVERNIRYSTVDLTWSTDEDANSSISISPTGTYSNNSEYTTTHSIAVSGLESNTYYAYIITTCDSNANCNTSTQSFTTASASSSGGAGGCIPIWECTPWSYCINNTQTRTCIDTNMCETNASLPDLNKTCIDKPLIIPGDNYTNFTLIDMGNYTWPWTPTDGVYHPTRLAAVISSILAHNLDETIYNIVASFGDYYYRPSFGWGILSILFMHITPFLGLYLLIGLLVRYSKIFSKSNKIIKFMIYGILIPLLVLFMTLLMPSV